MALIKCSECGREISDKAAACPGCGAPAPAMTAGLPRAAPSPSHITYDAQTDTFAGTMATVVKLAMRAIQQLDWKLDSANENLGLVTFQTGMSFGSWSGISGSLNIEEIEIGHFKVSGTGKQNLRGGQLIALNIAGEAQGKARKAIEVMKQLVSSVADKESRRASEEGVKKERHLHALALCSELKQKPIDLRSYMLLAEQAGGCIEARGLFIENYVYIKNGKITKLGKLEELRPWFVENIVSLIEKDAQGRSGRAD